MSDPNTSPAIANSSRRDPLRVLICGTTFGQLYLEALQAPGLPFELAGILAKGSQRSRSCAAFYGVPLFVDLDELPNDIDIACVVVRSGLLGGEGTGLAQSLMARGIHVLQEHPVHHDELAECLRQARRSQVYYQLNSFYPHLSTVRRFVKVAQALMLHRHVSYIDAACSMQVCYALFDILRITLGRIRPWAVAPVATLRDTPSGPFRSLEGMFAGLPLTLRIQNQLDPGAPDDYSYLLHRITLGTEAGELTLVTTHGPVVWSARPAIPPEVRDANGTSLFGKSRVVTDDTCTALLGPSEESSQQLLFRSIWPAAVRHALLELRLRILEGADPLRHGQGHLTLCRLWQDLATKLGPPELIRAEMRPSLLSPSELTSLRNAGSESDDPAA